MADDPTPLPKPDRHYSSSSTQWHSAAVSKIHVDLDGDNPDSTYHRVVVSELAMDERPGLTHAVHLQTMVWGNFGELFDFTRRLQDAVLDAIPDRTDDGYYDWAVVGLDAFGAPEAVIDRYLTAQGAYASLIGDGHDQAALDHVGGVVVAYVPDPGTEAAASVFDEPEGWDGSSPLQ